MSFGAGFELDTFTRFSIGNLIHDRRMTDPHMPYNDIENEE